MKLSNFCQRCIIFFFHTNSIFRILWEHVIAICESIILDNRLTVHIMKMIIAARLRDYKKKWLLLNGQHDFVYDREFAC